MATYLQKRRRQKRIKQILTLVLAVGIIVLFYIYLDGSKDQRISNEVRKNIQFSAMLPAKDTRPAGYSLEIPSIKVFKDQDDAILTYQLTNNNHRITVTEQEFPDVLIYERLENSIKPYAEIKTAVGSATLGRPDGPEGKQVAILNPAGLLIFTYPSKDLSENEWKEFFNSLEVVK